MAGREAARGTWWRPEVPPAGVGALAASVSSSHGTEGSPPPCPAMRREIRGLRKGREEEGGRPGACLQSVGERRFRNSPGRRGRASSAAAFGCRSSGPAGLPAPAPPGPGLTGRGPAPRDWRHHSQRTEACRPRRGRGVCREHRAAGPGTAGVARAGLRPRPLCLGANGSLSAPPPSGSGVGVTEALATDTPCGHGDGGGWHGPHGGAGSALCGRPGPGVVPVGELEQVRLLGSRPSFPPAGA